MTNDDMLQKIKYYMVESSQNTKTILIYWASVFYFYLFFLYLSPLLYFPHILIFTQIYIYIYIHIHIYIYTYIYKIGRASCRERV